MIYELRAKPSLARVHNILQKYVDHDAPLSVNISAGVRENAIRRAAACDPATKPVVLMDIFNAVQVGVRVVDDLHQSRRVIVVLNERSG